MSALLKTNHMFDLLEDDAQGIKIPCPAPSPSSDRRNFGSSSSGSFGGLFQPTYADLMTATDASGQTRSFLANEENFRFMKDLEARNLLVPLVGNFAGPKAIRDVGQYLTEKGATVSAFCRTSNSTCGWTASGTRFARTSPRCRSTRRAVSSDPCGASAARRTSVLIPSSAKCSPRSGTAAEPLGQSLMSAG